MNMYQKNECTYSLKKEIRERTFNVVCKITAEQIEDIVVDALECESNYWVGINNTTPEWANKPQGLPVSQYAVQLLLEGKAVTLFDIEDEDEEWELTLLKLLDGIGMALLDDDDSADACLQYALFGRIVYG